MKRGKTERGAGEGGRGEDKLKKVRWYSWLRKIQKVGGEADGWIDGLYMVRGDACVILINIK